VINQILTEMDGALQMTNMSHFMNIQIIYDV